MLSPDGKDISIKTSFLYIWVHTPTGMQEYKYLEELISWQVRLT